MNLIVEFDEYGISDGKLVKVMTIVDKDTDTAITQFEGEAVDDVLRKLIEVNESWEWCHECKEYDNDKHCCHRFTKVIREAVTDAMEAYAWHDLRKDPKDLPPYDADGYYSEDVLVVVMVDDMFVYSVGHYGDEWYLCTSREAHRVRKGDEVVAWAYIHDWYRSCL